MMPPKIDAIDRRILRLIQQDAARPIHEIAAAVGLSQTPCWKRLQRLEAAGVIRRRIALLDPVKLGLGVTVFVTVRLAEHSAQILADFGAALSDMEEVMEFYRMAGDVDYVLRVVAADAAAFDAFYKRLVALAPLREVTSRFVLETIKSETAFPIAG